MHAPPIPYGRTARRLTWEFLPPQLRAAIEAHLGGAVVEATSRDAGFTPGFASVLVTADGAGAFVKAANRKAQAAIAASYAEEGRKRKLLGDAVPAPALLWDIDDASEDGWVVLGFEVHPGRPPTRPWTEADLSSALDLAEEIADRTAALAPDTLAALSLDPLTEDIPELVTSWSRVAAVFGDREHLEDADDLARSLADLPDRALVHADMRADNILIDDGSGQAVACDWNWPALGPAWLDTVDLLTAARGDGIDVEPLLAARRLTRDADPDAIDAWLAAYCGFMTVASTRPAPSSSPFLAGHALWSAEASWDWLASRRGWQ